MKLLTKPIKKALPPLKSTDGKDKGTVPIIVKFFTPWSSWTWYVTEGEYSYDLKTWEFFGFVDGLEKEFGYFTLKDLEEVRGPAGLKIERDKWFVDVKLAEVVN